MMDTPVPKSTLDYNFSASKVKSFATCALKYWYQYASDETRTKPSEGYREVGIAVHEAIEEVMEDHIDTRDAGILAHRFKEKYRKKDPDVPEYLYERGLNCCDNAAKWWEHAGDVDVRGLEVREEFTINVPGLEKQFTAIMDVVVDGQIWDWKTGWPEDNNGDLYDRIPREEMIQGSVYATAYFNKYGEYPEGVTFLYLRDGVEARTIDVTDEKWNQMVQYAKMLQNAQEEERFPAEPGSHCNFCDYEYVCESRDVSMGNVTYWKY